MGQQKQINQQHNFLPTAIYIIAVFFSTFRWPFSLISACFVGLWKGRLKEYSGSVCGGQSHEVMFLGHLLIEKGIVDCEPPIEMLISSC